MKVCFGLSPTHLVVRIQRHHDLSPGCLQAHEIQAVPLIELPNDAAGLRCERGQNCRMLHVRGKGVRWWGGVSREVVVTVSSECILHKFANLAYSTLEIAIIVSLTRSRVQNSHPRTHLVSVGLGHGRLDGPAMHVSDEDTLHSSVTLDPLQSLLHFD